jgi:hypothetical protein
LVAKNHLLTLDNYQNQYRMKTLINKSFFLAIVFFSLVFTACKKETKTNANDSTNVKDANGVSNAVDATSDDATALAGQVVRMAGKTTSASWYMLCGSTTVDTGNGNQITLTYDGSTTCNGVKRSGQVVVTLATGSALWSQQGAVVNVAINNVTVTDVTNGNSFTLNGTHTITNETGGLAWQLWWNAPGGTVVKHRDRSSNMTVKFSDGTTGSWSVDRTRTWSLSNTGNVITFSVSTEAANNEDTWGTNRFGEQFNTNIATPISANNDNSLCLWRPYQGRYVYNVPSRSATASLTFGTNNSGTVVGTPTTCAPGYYLTYTLSTYNYNLNLFVLYW